MFDFLVARFFFLLSDSHSSSGSSNSNGTGTASSGDGDQRERESERGGGEALWHIVTYRHTDRCNPQREWHRCLHSGRGCCCSCPWSGYMKLQCSLEKKTITVDESALEKKTITLWMRVHWRKRQSLWMSVIFSKYESSIKLCSSHMLSNLWVYTDYQL